MNLYEIQDEILSCIDMETGEIIDAEKLDALKMEKAEKVRNIACWVKNLKADIAAYKAEEEVFAKRRKSAENKAASLTAYLQGFLNGEKVKAPEFEISWRTTKATQIDDENQLPAFYWKESKPTINREAILKALKAGEDVAGARLVEKKSMSIK